MSKSTVEAGRAGEAGLRGTARKSQSRKGMTQRQWDQGGHPARSLLLSLLVDTALVLVEPSPPHNQSQHSIPSMEAKTVCHPSSHKGRVTGGRDGCGETSREAHTGPGTSVPGGGGWASLKEGKGRNRIQTSNRAGAH